MTRGSRQELGASNPTQQAVAATRGAAVAGIPEISPKAWTQETHCHRRPLAETATGRHKTIIGPTLIARTFENRKAGMAIGARCLNQCTALGMPRSIRTG